MSTVYRDATFSRETRDRLETAAAFLADDLDHQTEADAVADVVRRWDENDATEITVTEGVPPA